jgi:hypothetical protein
LIMVTNHTVNVPFAVKQTISSQVRNQRGWEDIDRLVERERETKMGEPL